MKPATVPPSVHAEWIKANQLAPSVFSYYRDSARTMMTVSGSVGSTHTDGRFGVMVTRTATVCFVDGQRVSRNRFLFDVARDIASRIMYLPFELDRLN